MRGGKGGRGGNEICEGGEGRLNMKGCPENNEDEGKVGTGQEEEEGGMCTAEENARTLKLLGCSLSSRTCFFRSSLSAFLLYAS